MNDDDAEPTAQEHLATCHKSTMTQEQREEMIRVITMRFPVGEEPAAITVEQAAGLTDRQLCLTWLRMCDYISQADYQREFDACVGTSIDDQLKNKPV
jgi:hypothetical protein